MTIAAGAVGAALGGVKTPSRPRLAAPGAVLMTAGLIILWWGLGIFRGDNANGGAVGKARSVGGSFDRNGTGMLHGAPGGGGPPPTSGSTVVRTLRAVGFSGDSLVTALAVSRAESGWRPAAVGDVGLQDEKWGPSVGLFQIRSLVSEDQSGRPRDYTSLFDPEFNARAAYAISQGGTNWRAWTAYTSGAYRQYLDEARQLVAAS